MRPTYLIILIAWILTIVFICLSVSNWTAVHGFERQQTNEFEYNLKKLEDPNYDYYYEKKRQLERDRQIQEKFEEQQNQILNLDQERRNHNVKPR